MPSNKLIHETSPYLLQHAHNPVDWHPWGENALKKAKDEDKPILVSIGYAACHWCHVMEKESFEDLETAKLMNENFVNIKIDREERPDLDHIYMDAVQAMTGSGGWPLNVFLTPDAKPFYGGTYFPPVRAFNRASWKEVLRGVIEAFHQKRGEVAQQAENLTNHLIQSNSFGIQVEEPVFSRDDLHAIFNSLMRVADKHYGGFGKAPKFPQTFSIRYLFNYYYYFKEETALQHACLSLDKMIYGGIYDQLGGGFARYSTDNEWLVPHFEKMLYDNALLVTTLSEAYQLTKKDRYKETIIETMEFVKREMLSEEKGFFSALDADSEGEEGKYYVWSQTEIEQILNEDASLLCSYYNVIEKGNWEGTNILHIKKPLPEIAADHHLSEQECRQRIENAKKKLFAERLKRIRPLLDDKILLGWNALMNTACSKAFMATGNEEYKELALQNMHFIFDHFRNNEGKWHHTYKNGKVKYDAFIDDIAYLIQALIYLQEITGNTSFLFQAKELTEYVITHFSHSSTSLFLYTPQYQKDVIFRKKEVYDGAVPSGNAIMAYNLLYLSILFDQKQWREKSEQMITSLKHAIIKYPTSFGVWASLLQELTLGVNEIVATGKNISNWRDEILSIFIPNKVFLSADEINNSLPLLRGKTVEIKPAVFVCKNYTCYNPVNSIEALMLLMEVSKM